MRQRSEADEKTENPVPVLGERGLLEKRRLDEEAQPGGDGGGEEEEAREGGRETHGRQQAVSEE